MTAEFEEKEFESVLIHQLMMDSDNMWSPGQVFEGSFGIDTALEVLRPDFWTIIGHTDYPSGVSLSDYNFGYVWRKIRKKRTLPDFSLNLFLQVKRPEGLKNRPSDLKSLGLKSPYWRFWVKEHQQKLLIELSRKLNNRAFVAYTCPAFHKHKDLYLNTRNNSLIQNSTFIRVERLEGHHKWVYHCSGSTGIACSEAEKIEDKFLFDEISNSLENRDNIKSDANENLSFIEKSIIEITTESSKNNPIANEIMLRYDNIRNLEISRPSKSFVLIIFFAHLTNSNWITVG